MKITNVNINNWKPHEQWWNNVADSPDEPLINATITMILSWNEYQVLLKKDREDREDNTSTPN